MGYRSRELEKKIEVVGGGLDYVRSTIENFYHGKIRRAVYDSSPDTYWDLASAPGKGDFARVRDLGGVAQLTVKAQDRGDRGNSDRLELDIDTDATPAAAIRFMRSILGKPSGNVSKTYWVYWFVGEEHTTLSCYWVHGTETDRIYVEPEAIEEERLEELVGEVIDLFSTAPGIQVGIEKKSLFELFVQKEEEDRG